LSSIALTSPNLFLRWISFRVKSGKSAKYSLNNLHSKINALFSIDFTSTRSYMLRRPLREALRPVQRDGCAHHEPEEGPLIDKDDIQGNTLSCKLRVGGPGLRCVEQPGQIERRAILLRIPSSSWRKPRHALTAGEALPRDAMRLDRIYFPARRATTGASVSIWVSTISIQEIPKSSRLFCNV